MGNIFFDLTVIICLAAFFSLIARFFKQPEILAYILTGIVIASLHFFKSSNQDILQTMSQVGVTLLLFMVGLEIRVSELVSLGKTLILASVAQIGISFGVGFLLSTLLGFDQLTSFYIALALTFSSTIVVVKLLSDQRELHGLHAKFSLGILLAQDLAAILFLMFLSSFNLQAAGVSTLISFGLIILKGIILFSAIILLSETIFPKIIEFVAKSSETLFLVSLAWLFGLAALVSSPIVGFNLEIGGFLAGVALANSLASYQIIAKAKILRDFYIVIFFVLLGIQMSFVNLGQIILPSIIFSVFVLLGKPFIVMSIFSILGYKKRTSFLTGISLSQVSEFSLIIVFIGYKLGHINQTVVSVITLTCLICFFFSSFVIVNGKKLYLKVGTKLDFMERKSLKKIGAGVKNPLDDLKNHVVVVGGDQMGESIVEALQNMDKQVVVVDFDPVIIKKMDEQKTYRLFGDISDIDIQKRAQIDNAKVVISTVPDIEDNLLLLKELKHENRKAKIIVMALDSKDAKALYANGADYVVLPHLAGGRQLAKIILDDSLDKIEKLKEKDLRYLH